MVLTFPWPPAVLSPNARVHWSKRAAAAKSYKRTCWALALEAKVGKFGEGPILMSVLFSPPDNRRRDDDNMVASFKAGRDGLAAAMGVDDGRFKVSYDLAPYGIRDGTVKVHL